MTGIEAQVFFKLFTTSNVIYNFKCLEDKEGKQALDYDQWE